MRRFLSLFTVLMLCGVLAFAQNRVVSGRVIDNNGNPISFASISVQGLKSGIFADQNGSYSLKVNDGAVLTISATDYVEKTVTVGTSNFVTTTLDLKANTIKEVVVTGAVGIKRTARSVASNVQNVNAEALNTVRQSDVNNAIAGKVAGAQVRSQSGGKLGSASAIRLRGENGFGAGSGPIYVIDGTIMPNSNDINPDDIEDISVLQGPAAAALFGSDGSNGAIVINTKKARRSQRGLGIEINSGVTFDKVGQLPLYQNSYSGGDGATSDLVKYNWVAGQPEAWKALDGKYYHDYQNDASWGAKMVGQEYIPWYAWYGGSEYSYKTAYLNPQPNNLKDFYNTGVTKTNNINFSKAGDGYNARVSYTNLDITGIIPNQTLTRNTLNANFSLDLNSRFTVGANINYIAQNDNVENNDTYGNQTSGSFGSWFHRDLDMNIVRELQNLKTTSGVYASWNHKNPTVYSAAAPDNFYKANYWFNFYTYLNNVSFPDRRDRLFGDVSLQYKINNDLRIKATYRKQQLTTLNTATYYQALQQSISQGQWNPYEANSNAAYAVGNSYSDRQNYEVLMSYSKKIKSFAVNANAGFDILKTRARTYNANTFGGLSVDGLYSLANSKAAVQNSLRADKQQETVSQYIRRSPFIRADVGFKNFLFVEGSFRRDYISTQSIQSAPYVDTKVIGASFVFSDLIKGASNILSYGKLRFSMGQVLNELGIYQSGSTYTPNPDLFNGNLLMSEPNTLVSPTLTGAVNTEKEYGIDLRFLKNRLGLSATYYDRSNTEFPANVSVAGATGYSTISTNVGEVAKTGVELSFFVQPIKSKNLDLEINATWARYIKNEVVSITPGIDRLVSASGNYGGTYAAQAVSAVGQRWGQLYGSGYDRDADGNIKLDATGKYIKKAGLYFGSVLPDYTGGVQTKFTIFKNFIVNVNIDYSYGGKYFSLSDFWGTASGLTARTAAINDKGNSVRDAVADGGGVHVFGVDATTLKPIDYYVEAYDYFHQFQNSSINENSIYDLTYVKMREVSFGYRIPVEKLRLGKTITNATFSIMLRNPWLIYTKDKQFDPSEISGVQGENGQIPGTKSIGVNLKIGF